MTLEGFTKVFNKTVLGENELIPPHEAGDWLRDNMMGEITKEKLEEQRFKELSTLDMM